MRRQSRTEGLLRQREGLATPPAPSAAQQFAPLILAVAIAAVVTWSRRGDDDSFATQDLVFAGLVIALGLAASARTAFRAKRLAAEPVEGLLVRVGEHESAPGRTNPARPSRRAQAPLRWMVALEDGTQRAVHPVPGARGAERLARGARGVAWVKGQRLLGFEPVD